MTTLTNRKRGSDFVKTEWEQRYTRVSGTIKNQTGVAVAQGAIKPGQPLNLNGTQWETLNVGSEAGADGFFVDDRVVPAIGIGATTDLEYDILARGPALVNLDVVPDDPDGTTGAYDLSALETRLGALSPPIIVMREPTSTTVQTT